MAQYSSVPPAPYSPDTPEHYVSPVYENQLSDNKQPLASTTTADSGAGAKPERPVFARQRTGRAGGHLHTFGYKLSYVITGFWIFEIIATLIAIALHVTTYLILRGLNGQPVQPYVGSFTVNSLVALLVTFTKAAALLPVAGCIGQLKWRRFWSYQPLRDMQFYDSASRGVLGSLRLILRLKFWHLASLGALITIAGVAMDTLAQNVITIETRAVDILGDVSIPRVNDYSTYFSYRTDRVGSWPTANVVGSINYGFSFTSSIFDKPPALPVACDFQGEPKNCTFEPYQTLETGYQCINWSDYVVGLAEKNESITLPDGLTLEDYQGEGVLNISATTEYPTTASAQNFKNPGPLILNWQAIYYDRRNEALSAIQCLLYWDVNTYSQSNMTNSVLGNDRTTYWSNSSAEARTTYDQGEGIYMRPTDCLVNGTQAANTNTTDACLYYVSPMAQYSLQNYLTATMYGDGWVSTNGSDSSFATTFSNGVYQALYSKGKWHSDAWDGLKNTFGFGVEMINQAIRQQPTYLTGAFANLPRAAGGHVRELQNVFKMRYAYFSLNHFVVGGSAIFFILTALLCMKDNVLKNSVLPLLYHGFTSGDRAHMDENHRLADMKYASEETKMRFGDTSEGKRLGTHYAFGEVP